MLEQLIGMLKNWAMGETTVESVIIVGSYARGTMREASDLDVCVITTNKAEMMEHPDFIKVFGKFEKKQTEYYGACTSIRVWYTNGLEVEFGIVEPSWIYQPLDSGTYKVLSDGYQVIVDKKQYFENLNL